VSKFAGCFMPEPRKVKNTSFGQSPTLLELLKRDASAGILLPAAERILEIQRELRRSIPPGVAADCEVCGLEDGNLTVQVSSASAASKLRQTLPRLIESLALRGWKISAIRLRVQPRVSSWESAAYRPQKEKNARMPASAVEKFRQLAVSLAPSSPLRTALENAVRRREKPADQFSGELGRQARRKACGASFSSSKLTTS